LQIIAVTALIKITLLRVIPAMTFIHFVTGKSSGFYLTYLLTFYLAFYLAYLLAFYLANLLAYYLLKSSDILSGKHSGRHSI